MKFDNDEPKPLRCKFYNYELTKLLQNFPDEIYRENNILPKNDLDTLGLYAFVNEFNQIGGNDDAFEHKTEVTFQVGRKGNIKFDLSSFEKYKEFYINNLEFLKC